MQCKINAPYISTGYNTSNNSYNKIVSSFQLGVKKWSQFVKPVNMSSCEWLYIPIFLHYNFIKKYAF